MDWNELKDWELDRLLTEYEMAISEKKAYINILSKRQNNIARINYLWGQIEELESRKGQVRAEIAKRHPNGFPPILIG